MAMTITANVNYNEESDIFPQRRFIVPLRRDNDSANNDGDNDDDNDDDDDDDKDDENDDSVICQGTRSDKSKLGVASTPHKRINQLQRHPWRKPGVGGGGWREEGKT